MKRSNQEDQPRKHVAVGRGLKASEGADLTDDDEDGSGVDEAGDHRMAQQVDDAAEPRQPQQQKKQAHLQAQHGGDGQILMAVGRRELAHRRRHHQGSNGNRPHHQLPRRAKRRIDHHRHQTGV